MKCLRCRRVAYKDYSLCKTHLNFYGIHEKLLLTASKKVKKMVNEATKQCIIPGCKRDDFGYSVCYKHLNYIKERLNNIISVDSEKQSILFVFIIYLYLNYSIQSLVNRINYLDNQLKYIMNTCYEDIGFLSYPFFLHKTKNKVLKTLFRPVDEKNIVKIQSKKINNDFEKEYKNLIRYMYNLYDIKNNKVKVNT